MRPSDFIADFFGATEGSIYLCSLPNERGTGQPAEVCGRGSGDRLDELVSQQWDQKGRGTFFCVNTLRPRQSRRSKETVHEITCLHADLDLGKIDVSADDVLARLASLPFLPSKVVNSGHGFHAYWLLNEALAATPENIAHVEGLLRSLSAAVGGDPTVCEVARLMRLPGSHNTKNGDRLPVKVIVDRPLRHELSDLEEWLSEQRPIIPCKGSAPPNNPFLAVDVPGAGGAAVDIDARLAAMRFQGAGDTSVHQTQLAVSAAMLNRGHSVDDTVDAILQATRTASGNFGVLWNWKREEQNIRAMCASWGKKKTNGQQVHAEQPTPEKSQAFNAVEVEAMEFTEIKFVVPGYIVEGLTLFAGKPKIGKSWLLLHAAHAVARGGVTLGDAQCEAGSALYCALEDSPRRLQSRMRKLFPYTPPPRLLFFFTEMPRLTEGGLDFIRGWIEGADHPRLIIIDTLAMVRMPNKKTDTAYDADYKAVVALRDLAHAKSVAIVLVHHLRKAEADDAYDTVSGTLGLTGAPDTIMILRRDGENCTLRAKGRDLEEIEKAVQFDAETCTWTVLGEAKDVRQSDQRSAITEVLKEAEEPMTPGEIATACGMRPVNVRNLLARMRRDGVVTKSARGKYALP